MTQGQSNTFLLLYASQTGQAKAIAEEIAEKAALHGLCANMHCVSETEKKFWLERESCVVMVCSTTGEGDPPETATKFWRRLKKKTLPDDHLKHLNYILLGLGDSNYTNFCNFGKNVDRRFEDLGAKKLIPSTFADDAVGLEVAVEPWMDDLLFSALKTYFEHINEQVNDVEHKHSTGVNDTNITLNKESTETANDGKNIATNIEVGFIETNEYKPEHVQISETSDKNVEVDQQHDKDINIPESLMHSLPPLSEGSLNLPLCPPRFLDLKYNPEIDVDLCSLPIQNSYPFPSAKTDIQKVPVASAEVLTNHSSLKTTLSFSLDISATKWSYQPGDSFGIICVNPVKEVDQLINRLDLSATADTLCQIVVTEGTKKKNAAIPAFLSKQATLRYWLTTTLDIRSVPKKAFLRALIEYTTDQKEKRRLQELCSKQGAIHYSKYIREPGLGLIDILSHFTSCNPPASLLLEHLPRLMPRPYSAASCLEAKPGQLDFVFNIVEIPAGDGRCESKLGICTGMLSKMRSLLHKETADGLSEVTKALKMLNLGDFPQVQVFLRDNQHFHPPADFSKPLIMVGPGTGVAPFIGFLQQRELHSNSNHSLLGETWLFFGCRHKDRDYIFRNDLNHFVESGVLNHLKVCFSRDSVEKSNGPRYVQDNIILHSTDLVTLIFDKGCEIFVCGDANHMAKDVRQAFVKIIQTEKDLSLKEAEAVIVDMVIKKRYHEDVWS